MRNWQRFAQVAEAIEPFWGCSVFLVMQGCDSLLETIKARKDAWKDLEWQFVSTSKACPKTAGAKVGESDLAEVFGGNAKLLGHETVLPWCGWLVQVELGGGSPT